MISAEMAKDIINDDLTEYQKSLIDVQTVTGMFDINFVCLKGDFPARVSYESFEPYLLSDKSIVQKMVQEIAKNKGYVVTVEGDDIIIDLDKEF